MSPQLIAWVAIGVLLAFVLALTGLWALSTANRLNRLHVRGDLSWQALEGVLARRAVVARAVAVEGYRDDGAVAEGKRLVALADTAERAPREVREAAENELSAALAMVDLHRLPAPLVAELADAEARVLLARRFHNDAVRDTLALRERPMVRLLRLGGHAPSPTYFEIAERISERAYSGAAADSDAESARSLRTSARVVLVDEHGAVLLLCGSDPAITDGTARKWWFTVGGQTLDGEDLAAAAARELGEETGLRVAAGAMVGPIWRRDAMIDFNGSVMRSREFFFVHRTRRFEPSVAGRTALERRYIHGHRWCDSAAIEALSAGGETVYPLQLGELLARAVALADAPGSVTEPVAIR